MMCRIPSSPPTISPLRVKEQDRPLWSVMIPVFNCSDYLEETLTSVLLQGIPEEDMQIEVVDDASTDTNVAALVHDLGKGRVKYYRQPQNVGSLRNFETCINRAQGKLVHILHGDDRVREGYYLAMSQLFERYPEAGAAFCRYTAIDESGKLVYEQRPEMQHEGILENWLLKIAVHQRIQYVAIAIRREVFERLGGFYGVTYGEDWEMWTRIARNYPVAYTPAILANYRKHSSSISGIKHLTGQNLLDLAKVMELIQMHLPKAQREVILKRSRRYYAYYGVSMASKLWQRLHDKQVVKAQIQHALYLTKTPGLYWKVAQVYAKIYLHSIWRSE